VFNEQTETGWNDLFLGRISNKWGRANEKLTSDYKNPQDPTTWNARFIREAMKLVLSLLSDRNKQTHGNIGNKSIAERDETVKTLQRYYKLVKPLVPPQDLWLFQQSEKRKIQDTFLIQISWVDALERNCRHILIATECDRTLTRTKMLTF